MPADDGSSRSLDQRLVIGFRSTVERVLSIVLAVGLGGIALLIVSVFAVLAISDCDADLPHPEGYARRALVPISGPTQVQVRNAYAYADAQMKANEFFFFEIAPLAAGRAATVDEIERRLATNRWTASTRPWDQPKTYERRDSMSARSLSEEKQPSWWPQGRDETVTCFVYECGGSITLYVMSDGTTFGYGAIPD